MVFAVSGVFYRIDAGPLQVRGINSVGNHEETIQLATSRTTASDSMMIRAVRLGPSMGGGRIVVAVKDNDGAVANTGRGGRAVSKRWMRASHRTPAATVSIRRALRWCRRAASRFGNNVLRRRFWLRTALTCP